MASKLARTRSRRDTQHSEQKHHKTPTRAGRHTRQNPHRRIWAGGKHDHALKFSGENNGNHKNRAKTADKICSGEEPERRGERERERGCDRASFPASVSARASGDGHAGGQGIITSTLAAVLLRSAPARECGGKVGRRAAEQAACTSAFSFR